MGHPLRVQGVALACLALLLASCGQEGSEAQAPEEGERPAREVVLYSSVDRYLMEQVILPAAEAATGLEITYVGDTEATKTTGLVERLITEKGSPRADVWWSSEAFGSIKLADEGILEPATIEAAEEAFPGGWPARLRGDNGTWYGFAERARVIAVHADRVDAEERPRTLAELTGPKWKGRVGIAKPQFGTTRGHMAVLLGEWGEQAFRRWLRGLRDNDVRVYDGNATVVRAIWRGEIDAGLTDTDDVWAAKREDMPVDMVFEIDDPLAVPPSFGPLLLPNTAGLVAGGPNPEAARELLAYILSPEVERLLAQSESRNIPVHPSVASDFPELMVPGHAEADLGVAADLVPRAMEIVEEVLGP